MDPKLSELVHASTASTDALTGGEAHSASRTTSMRKLSVSLGPEHDLIEDDRAQLLAHLYRARYLAECGHANDAKNGAHHTLPPPQAR